MTSLGQTKTLSSNASSGSRRRNPFRPLTGEEYGYLIVEGTILSPLPALRIRAPKEQTTSHAGSIKKCFDGSMTGWPLLKRDVIRFFRSPDLQYAFDLCETAPSDMHPMIRLNEFTMDQPLLQLGAEISLSCSFLLYALKACLSAAMKLESELHIKDLGLKIIQQGKESGDSFTVPKHNRVQGEEPDVVYKIHTGANEEVRLVGELKHCVTVPLGVMCAKNRRGDSKDLRALLGQIVNYMLEYRTKYGFISTYEHTMFLMIDTNEDGKPCIYLRSPIDTRQGFRNSATILMMPKRTESVATLLWVSKTWMTCMAYTTVLTLLIVEAALSLIIFDLKTVTSQAIEQVCGSKNAFKS